MEHSRLLLSSLLLLISIIPHAHSSTFTIVNKCPYTIWPATLSGATSPQLPPGSSGFSLTSTSSITLSAPLHWSGRIWARTSCSTDPNTTHFSCLTGDCTTGTIPCSGHGSSPPTTLAEFTLNGANGLDFYDVSLVDGFNIPLVILPRFHPTTAPDVKNRGNCSAAGCYVDLNDACPTTLKVRRQSPSVDVAAVESKNSSTVACRSACEAFGDPEYCCSGEHTNPDTCKPSVYSEFFKKTCPTAYSYAFDDPTSTFTCAAGAADYVITFCPTPVATSKSTDSNEGQQQLLASQPPPSSSTSYIWPSSTYYNGAATTSLSSSLVLILLLFLFSAAT